MKKELGFIRARGEEQKEIRRQQIVDAAAALYAEVGYDKVTFSKIGRKVSFTRLNLYNYYQCKEDIFLTLQDEDVVFLRGFGLQDELHAVDVDGEDALRGGAVVFEITRHLLRLLPVHAEDQRAVLAARHLGFIFRHRLSPRLFRQ